MTRRFLITTSIQDTWKTDVPVLFLGEWCKRYEQKDRWMHLDSETVPYRWNDRKLVYQDYQYTEELYGRILPALGEHLNTLHGVDYPTRYWRIIVGPWLSVFIQIVFERWMQLKEAQKYDIAGVNVAAAPDPGFVPRDMLNFAQLFTTDSWNYYIYSFIIRKHSAIPWNERSYSPAKPLDNSRDRGGFKAGLRQVIWDLFEKLERRRDGMINDLSLSLKSKIRLFLRYGYLERNINDSSIPGFEMKPAQREWELAVHASDDFENCLMELIPVQLPTAYLEGYQTIRQRTHQLRLPKRPQFIATSYMHYGEVFKFWTAEKIMRGTKLLVAQHGGGYGIGKWFSNEQHEICSADNFLSWGWTDNRSKVLPAGCLKKNPFKKRDRFDQQDCLLILGSTPVYSYKLYSEVIASQWLSYFEDQCNFVAALPDSFKKNILLKAYEPDFGWDHVSRFKDRLPGVRISSGRKLSDLSDQSRVVVSTYNSTSFLETLSNNIPTIVFWDPQYWELRESAIPFFEELKTVGIFHTSPVQAAQQVALVWDHVEEWWMRADLQAVVQKFVQQFCRQSDNPARELIKCIQEATLIKVNQR